MAGEGFGGGKRTRRKELFTAAHPISHTIHWTAAFLRAKFKYFVPSRAQKVILAGKAQDRPSHFSEELSLCLLRRALVVKICRIRPCRWDQLIPSKKAPSLRHFQQGFPAQQSQHAPSFSRNVAKRHLWRCQCLLTAYRGNILQQAWTQYLTLMWLQRDEMNSSQILPLLITLWLT